MNDGRYEVLVEINVVKVVFNGSHERVLKLKGRRVREMIGNNEKSVNVIGLNGVDDGRVVEIVDVDRGRYDFFDKYFESVVVKEANGVVNERNESGMIWRNNEMSKS